MPRYRTTFEVPGSIEKTFDYLADLSNAKEWDPGVTDAERLSEGPIGVGSEFRIAVSLLGIPLGLTYEVAELEPQRRLLFVADSVLVRSEDELSFEPAGSGTRVTYDSRLRVKGFAGLAEPLWQGLFERISDRALAGLRGQLGGGTPATPED